MTSPALSDAPAAPRDCPKCNGKGQVEITHSAPEYIDTMACFDCGGTGNVPAAEPAPEVAKRGDGIRSSGGAP